MRNSSIELQFDNPSLLILLADETEFFIISNDEIIGKCNMESFTLQPLDSCFIKSTVHTDVNSNESQSEKISSVTKYYMLVTSIDVPFVYYPTE